MNLTISLPDSEVRALEMKADQNIIVNLSGRGDKDVDEASRLLAARGESHQGR